MCISEWFLKGVHVTLRRLLKIIIFATPIIKALNVYNGALLLLLVT